MKAKITGIGHYLPNKIVSNEDLATQYDITGGSERIYQKTGIRQRHYLEILMIHQFNLQSSINNLLKKMISICKIYKIKEFQICQKEQITN